MAGKKGGLGRGLDALFADNAMEAETGVKTVPIGEIEPDREQPRKNFDTDALTELAQSIEQHGVIQPILVRPRASGGYTIVAGERRWRASRMAGLLEVPIIIREMTDLEAAEVSLIENLQREDLNPIEEAYGYRQLMDKFQLTQDAAAQKVGKSRPAVANALRLLSLPAEVIELTRSGELSAGHARALAGLQSSELIVEAAKRTVAHGLSVRETEKLAKVLSKEPKAQKPQSSRLSLYDEVEIALRDTMGRRIKVVPKGEGGTLQIEFLNREELIDLVNKLGENR